MDKGTSEIASSKSICQDMPPSSHTNKITSNGGESVDSDIAGGIRSYSRHSSFSVVDICKDVSTPGGVSEAGSISNGGGAASKQGPIEVDSALLSRLSLGMLLPNPS